MQGCRPQLMRDPLAASIPVEIAQIAAGELSLDARVRRYIHDRLSYRWVGTADGASAYALEAQICRGALAAGLPLLNPRGAAI
jgi:hypothetical protein